MGAFAKTGLEEHIKKLRVTQVMIAGFATSLGVESTARQAYELGFNVTLAVDAMTDINADAHVNSVESSRVLAKPARQKRSSISSKPPAKKGAPGDGMDALPFLLLRRRASQTLCRIFFSGLMGRPVQCPFAKPPGEGLSSSTVNVLWGGI